MNVQPQDSSTGAYPLWGKADESDTSSGTGWVSVPAKKFIPQVPRYTSRQSRVLKSLSPPINLADISRPLLTQSSDSNIKKTPLKTLCANKNEVQQSLSEDRDEMLFYWCQEITESYPDTHQADDAWLSMFELCLENRFGQDILPEWLIVETLIELHTSKDYRVIQLLEQVMKHPRYKTTAERLNVIVVLEPNRF